MKMPQMSQLLARKLGVFGQIDGHIKWEADILFEQE